MERVGIVMTTLGRLGPVEHLLESLRGQLRDHDRVVVVAQGHEAELRSLCSRYQRMGLPLEITSSARGASLGRNTGAQLLGDTVDVLHFPNDTSSYPEGLVEHIRGACIDTPLAALTPLAGIEPKVALPPPGTALNRRTAWAVLEVGLVIRQSVFADLGGFDVLIGTGALSPWQAGEGTDLVLRAWKVLGPDCITWLDPSVTLGGVAETHGLTSEQRRRKLRAYNRGLGRVTRRWRYPLAWTIVFVLGGLAWSLRHPGYALMDGWGVAVGRLEGVIGRVAGGSPRQAVETCAYMDEHWRVRPGVRLSKTFRWRDGSR